MSTNQAAIQYELDERARLETEARAIYETARTENREPNAEEEERWDALIAESDRRKERVAKLERMDQEAALMADIRSKLGMSGDGGSGGDDVGDESIPAFYAREALRQIDLYNGGSRFSGETGVEARVRDEARAIANFSDGASLYVDEFATTVAVYARTLSPWLQVATVRNSTNGRPLRVPTLTADPTIYTPGEGTAITEATPTLGTAVVSLVGYKGLAYVSMEADEDDMYDVMPYISRSQGRQIGLSAGSAFTTTIVAAAANGGTATGLTGGGTATFVGYEDIVDLKLGRAAPYRLTGGFVMSNGVIKLARKWKNLDGHYIWQPSAQQGQPDLLDGDPVYEDPFLAAPGSATKSVLYGDLSAVLVKQVPLRFAVSTDVRFEEDQIALKAVLRAACALPDTSAIAYLVSKNT